MWRLVAGLVLGAWVARRRAATAPPPVAPAVPVPVQTTDAGKPRKPSWPITLAGVFCAFLLTMSFFASSGGIPFYTLPEYVPSRDFYLAVAAALPTLLVAFVLELRQFLRQLARWSELEIFGVIAVLGNLFNVGVGELESLRGIACPGVKACGTAGDFHQVVFGLISAGALVAAASILALITVVLELPPLRPRDQLKWRP